MAEQLILKGTLEGHVSAALLPRSYECQTDGFDRDINPMLEGADG